ncbi:hypothetical protein JST97_34085 [bacterium]|nr:hypothetical protein [bacterium]
MKKALFLVGLSLAGWAAGQRLFINGKPAAHGLLQHQGKTWICLDDLKAGGAQVTSTSDGLTIRFRPDEGGAQQITAVEGRHGEWLFNGIWRLQAGSPTLIRKPFSGEPGTPGWGIQVELRNGATREVSLQQTGVQLPTLALRNGTVLKADEGDWQQICFRALLPGATVKHQLKFYFPHATPDSAAEPGQRLVVPVDTNFGLLKDTGLRYSTPAPSIRVSF